MEEVCNLLEYIGLSEDDLETVYYKIYYWDFVKSLAEQLEERGYLSDKQQNALIDIIKKNTGAVCKPEYLTHSTKYKRKGKGKPLGKRVDHNFGNLTTIQLYDLPFEHESTQTLSFFPYNSHNVVVKIKGRFYKIPLPSTWNKPTECISITFIYRRTAMKGYMVKE